MPCGLNGALYFSEMPADGGKSKYPTNKAGAKYGTGYCDAQCPHDIKWIHGEANSKNWQPSASDVNAGKGHYGSCCAEMDIWEANKESSAFTAHPCAFSGDLRCEGKDCGDNDLGQRFQGVCDKDGCDINPFRHGVEDFFGPGKKVDTNKPFTVVTQFLTSDNTDNGDLVEIKRFFVQNGQKIEHPMSNLPGIQPHNSIKDSSCAAVKKVFGDNNEFQNKGGLKKMGESLERGMVLVMSMWDDHEANMLWLDSDYPLDKSPSTPGIHRGPCSRTSGDPRDVESQFPNSSVKYFNVKVGNIGTTTVFAQFE
jgi:cellulose 1,4-beta-cellobiosidase